MSGDPVPNFTYDEWLKAWEETKEAQGEDTGMTISELCEAWHCGRDAATRRRKILMKAGKLNCTWALKRYANGNVQRTTVYVKIP
jgi:hypothetical protein